MSELQGYGVGWAVAKDGTIDISTVSPSDIGAMVNWVTCITGCIVEASNTNEQIKAAFDQIAAPHGFRLIRVTCAEIKENGQ